MGQGEYDMEVHYRKELSPELPDPIPGIYKVALDTMPVATGVIGKVYRPTPIAFEYMAPHGLCAAIDDIPQNTSVTPKHAIREPLEVLRAVSPEDFGKIRHGGIPWFERSKLRHQVL